MVLPTPVPGWVVSRAVHPGHPWCRDCRAPLTTPAAQCTGPHQALPPLASCTLGVQCRWLTTLYRKQGKVMLFLHSPRSTGSRGKLYCSRGNRRPCCSHWASCFPLPAPGLMQDRGHSSSRRACHRTKRSSCRRGAPGPGRADCVKGRAGCGRRRRFGQQMNAPHRPLGRSTPRCRCRLGAGCRLRPPRPHSNCAVASTMAEP